MPIKRSIIKEPRDYNTFFFRKKNQSSSPLAVRNYKKRHIEEKVNEINNISKSRKLTIEKENIINHLD